MKKILIKLLSTCAVMFCTLTFSQNFNNNNDLLLANFDLKPDSDDVMAAAALASMMAHPDFQGVNLYAVAGAYGTQDFEFIDDAVPGLFNTLFGAENTHWTNADTNWNASVNRAADRVVLVLNEGGKVFVQEGGQSDFTYDVLQAAISSGIALSTIQSDVTVVQHTIAFNEKFTTEFKLDWVKDNTVYINQRDAGMDNGNIAGNGSPGFKSTNTTFMDQALSANNPNETARAYWTAADNVIQNWDGAWTNNTIINGGVDFSDFVEDWYIFDLGNAYNTGNEDNDITAFWNEFVINTVGINPNPNPSGNLALNGTASQSTTGYGGLASRAIDGDTNGAFGQGSVTHTTLETNPWWQVNLDAEYSIGDINIFNRSGGNSDRLSNFTVFVYDATDEEVYTKTFTSPPNPSVTANANNVMGQRIVIVLNATSLLSLAEVQVMAGVNTGNNSPNFTVDPINSAPATVNNFYSSSIAGLATDDDADSLTYSKQNGPSWLNVNSSGVLSGTPSAGDTGANSWNVQVSDGNGRTDTATLQISVSSSDTQELVASWTLNDGSGSVASDQTGNGHDGTITSAAWINHLGGSALDFNGSNSSVSLPASAFANINNEVSIAMWVNGGITNPVNNSVFYATDSAGNRLLNIHLPWSNGKVYWDSGNESGYDRIVKLATAAEYKGSWQHWVFTKNAITGVQNIYLNGTLWHTGSGKNASISTITTATFGSNISSSSYNGAIDDVMLYNVALTSAEVEALYLGN